MKGNPHDGSGQEEDEQSKKVLILALTWAPKPCYQRNDPIEGYKIQLPVIRILTRCCSHIKLYPELFVNGGLHYHARLVVNDIIKWYRQVLPDLKMRGFVTVKKNPDEGWNKYIEKDWTDVQKILDLSRPLDLALLKKRNPKVKPIFDNQVYWKIDKFISEEPVINESDSVSESF